MVHQGYIFCIFIPPPRGGKKISKYPLWGKKFEKEEKKGGKERKKGRKERKKGEEREKRKEKRGEKKKKGKKEEKMCIFSYNYGFTVWGKKYDSGGVKKYNFKKYIHPCIYICSFSYKKGIAATLKKGLQKSTLVNCS